MLRSMGTGPVSSDFLSFLFEARSVVRDGRLGGYPFNAEAAVSIAGRSQAEQEAGFLRQR